MPTNMTTVTTRGKGIIDALMREADTAKVNLINLCIPTDPILEIFPERKGEVNREVTAVVEVVEEGEGCLSVVVFWAVVGGAVDFRDLRRGTAHPLTVLVFLDLSQQADMARQIPALQITEIFLPWANLIGTLDQEMADSILQDQEKVVTDPASVISGKGMTRAIDPWVSTITHPRVGETEAIVQETASFPQTTGTTVGQEVAIVRRHPENEISAETIPIETIDPWIDRLLFEEVVVVVAGVVVAVANLDVMTDIKIETRYGSEKMFLYLVALRVWTEMYFEVYTL